MKMANAATIVARMDLIFMRPKIGVDMLRSQHSSGVERALIQPCHLV
jgi:hypothetical protein